MKSLKNKTHFWIIVVFFVMLIIAYNISFEPEKKQPTVKNGVLDLTGWDFKKDGVVNLDGKWEFYWKELLNYKYFQNNIENKNRNYEQVPSVWTRYTLNSGKLPAEGYATYRLKVRIKDTESLKGLKLLTMSTAYKLMVDEKVVATSGVVGKNKEETTPEFMTQSVTVETPKEEFEIIVQVSNYIYSRGGIWHSIYLGTDQQIRTLQEKCKAKGLVIFGALIIMSLYHIAIFVLQKRNILALYFAIGIFLIAIRILVTGEYFIYTIAPYFNIRWMIEIEYLTMYWSVIMWVVFIHELYPEETLKKSRQVVLFMGSMLSIFTIVAPIGVYTKYLIFYEILLGIVLIYALVCIFLAVLRKKEDAALLIIGALAAVLFLINDVLYQGNSIHSKYGGNFGFAAVMLIFIEAYILAERFSKSFEQVEELSDKLISLDKLKDEFLANTSHELRTPLNGIIGITECLIQGVEGTLNEGQKENLNIVVESGRRLSYLINDILDVCKLKNKDIEVYLTSVDLIKTFRPVVKVFQQIYSEKPIEFKYEFPERLPLVYADEDRLLQILYNLLENAVKFTEEGYVCIRAVQREAVVEISIEDTGIGIPEEKLQDIWKSFEQIDPSMTRKYGGTGLGLYITKKLVELQGGSIEVVSEIKKGSKFMFSLPINKEKLLNEKEESILQDLTEQVLENNDFVVKQDGAEILVADDDATNLKVIFNALKLEGYSITAVNSGKKVLEELKQQKDVALVISDVMMPEISGYEVCKKIREKRTAFDLPVLLLTAKNQQSDISFGFQCGANDFLTKPFEIGELKARVKTLVELKKSVDKALFTEVAFLQAQIKPHFLYNALNAISYFCTEDGEKAEELIDSLSTYLRNSFDFSNLNRFIPLKKEMELVKAYIEIEKARFGNRLQVEFHIEAGIDIELPPLVLQPLVENAIKHGILKREIGGVVKVEIKNNKTGVSFSVIDNGVGIKKEKFSALFNEDNGSRSVGLKNINMRLKKLYGAQLEISTEDNKGTKVSFLIPKHEGGVPR